MRAFQAFLSVDPALGRFDYSLLPDQALMEMLIEGFRYQTREECQDEHGMNLDVCEWSFVKCDDDNRVIEIEDLRAFEGSLQLSYVSPKVGKLHIDGGELTGSVDLTKLPGEMKELYLGYNQFTEEVDLTELPKGMGILVLLMNQFTGEVNLSQLPEGMRMLHLDNNQFTGLVELTKLPDGIKELSLHQNHFTGKLD